MRFAIDVLPNKVPPQPHEYAAYYEPYIQQTIRQGILDNANIQSDEVLKIYRNLENKEQLFRYAPDKWSMRQLLGHLIDSERIFGYRLHRFAANDPTALPGFDENKFIEGQSYNSIESNDLISEWHLMRQTNLYLIHRIPVSALDMIGTANEKQMTVRALVYILFGHVAHHVEVIKERYLPFLPTLKNYYAN